MTRLYGISNCDTCRKARKTLEKSGVAVVFRDIREDPLTPGEIARFLREFDAELVNSRSTTWRGLDEAARARPPEALLAEHPTLMKRPVIETGKVLTLGWSDAIAARHIAA